MNRLAAECQREGQERAEPGAATQRARYREILKQSGPLTDWDAAEAMGLLRCTVNARRNECMREGDVRAVDKIVNPVTGIQNTRWGLVEGGLS